MIATGDILLECLAWGAVLVVGVVMTGLYCGMETGIYVLNKLRIDIRAESGYRPAVRLRGLLNNYNKLLATLLIGTNLSSYAATFAVSAVYVLLGAGEHAEWYTIATATPILFILSESVPKQVFQRLGERLVYRLVWLLSASNIVFRVCLVSPLVLGFSWILMQLTPAGRGHRIRVGHEGVATVMAEGRASGVLTHFQSVMADRVMGIDSIHLSAVMVPMRHALTAPRTITIDALKSLVHTHNYSRLPLLDEAGRAVGIIDVYEVLLANGHTPPADRARTPLVLTGTTDVPEAFSRMQREQTTMAVVADEEGEHIGIVTIKDLVEEIVGELYAW